MQEMGQLCAESFGGRDTKGGSTMNGSTIGMNRNGRGVWVVGQVIFVVCGLWRTYSPGHAKITDSADTHFVNEHILKFHIPMNKKSNLVEIAETPYDLAKHHASIVLGQSGIAVPFENIKEGTSWAV